MLGVAAVGRATRLTFVLPRGGRSRFTRPSFHRGRRDVIQLAMPGVDPKDVQVSWMDNVLTVERALRFPNLPHPSVAMRRIIEVKAA